MDSVARGTGQNRTNQGKVKSIRERSVGGNRKQARRLTKNGGRGAEEYLSVPPPVTSRPLADPASLRRPSPPSRARPRSRCHPAPSSPIPAARARRRAHRQARQVKLATDPGVSRSPWSGGGGGVRVEWRWRWRWTESGGDGGVV